MVAEPFRQWVIEDEFANGRPRWEDVGVLFSDRVHDWELYKLRLLNAGHSRHGLPRRAGRASRTSTRPWRSPRCDASSTTCSRTRPSRRCTEIPGHPPGDYVASVLERFANTGVRDQIARLCIDGSAKFPTFLLPTVMFQLAARRTDRPQRPGAGRMGPVPGRHPDGRAGLRRRRRRGATARPSGHRRADAVPRLRGGVPEGGARQPPLPRRLRRRVAARRRRGPTRRDGGVTVRSPVSGRCSTDDDDRRPSSGTSAWRRQAPASPPARDLRARPAERLGRRLRSGAALRRDDRDDPP